VAICKLSRTLLNAASEFPNRDVPEHLAMMWIFPLWVAYGPNYPRLKEVKKKYDPNSVLRLNQNIKPA
jgi:hypothetical protein